MRLRALSLAIMMAFVLGVGIPAYAANYLVKDIEVAADAANATEARTAAMSQAEQEAFKKLMGEMLPADQAAAKIGQAQAWQISQMVRGYEVHNEKISGTHYSATFDVNFDPNQVNQFVGNASTAAPAAVPGAPALVATVNPAQPAAANPAMPASPAPSNEYGFGPAGTVPTDVPNAPAVAGAKGAVLVVPMMRPAAGGAPLLWDKENRWRDAWGQIQNKGDSVRLPMSDQSDSAMLSVSQATQGGADSFSLISERYQVSNILVAEATLQESAEPMRLDVKLRSINRTDGYIENLDMSYEAPYEEDAAQLMARAAQDITNRVVNQDAAGAVPPPPAVVNQLTVLTKLNRLTDWVNIRGRLQALPAVEKVELAAISSQQADIVLYYRGKPETLATSMTSQGLKVEQAYNYWVISY